MIKWLRSILAGWLVYLCKIGMSQEVDTDPIPQKTKKQHENIPMLQLFAEALLNRGLCLDRYGKEICAGKKVVPFISCRACWRPHYWTVWNWFQRYGAMAESPVVFSLPVSEQKHLLGLLLKLQKKIAASAKLGFDGAIYATDTPMRSADRPWSRAGSWLKKCWLFELTRPKAVGIIHPEALASFQRRPQ